MVWPTAVSKLLKDCAVECIWTVAMAVGRNTFKNDAAEVVALIRSVRRFLVEEDHTLKVALLRAWEQLLSCLGSHFYPHLEDLMPDLLKSASLIGCDTECVILTEKFMACKVLFCLTKKFKKKFFPWIDQVADILVPLVKFDDGDIRKIAVSAMPELLLSAKLSIEDKEAIWRLPNSCPRHAAPIALGLTNSYLIKLVRQVVPSLLEALNKERDGEICATILNCLSRCIKIAAGFQSKRKIDRIVNAIKQVLKATSRNHFAEAENVTEQEKEIIKQAVKFFRTLIKKYKESSWRFVEELMECVKAMLGNNVTTKEKQIALLSFNEVCLKCKGAALRYSNKHLPLILEACKTENQDVQKEAARGLGLIAEFGGTQPVIPFRDIASTLCAMIKQSDKGPHDVAVSALGKLLNFHVHDEPIIAEVVSLWLNSLPVMNDLIEARAANEQLALMIEKLDKDILGLNNVNIPKILDIIDEVLRQADDLATEETKNRMTGFKNTQIFPSFYPA